MKPLFPLSLLLLAGCASVAPATSPAAPVAAPAAKQGRVITQLEFYGPLRDAGGASRSLEKKGTIAVTKPMAKPTSIRYPMQFASVCEKQPFGCLHGVLKTELDVQITEVRPDGVTLSGVLHSAVGKEQTETEPATTTSLAMSRIQSIAEGSPAIRDEAKDIPFNASLKFGEHLKLDGLVGSLINIQVRQEAAPKP